MLASVPLFLEYEAVATRSEHLAASGFSRADVMGILDVLAALVEETEIHYLWRPRLRDPDDDMVLELAVNGRAEAIVTFNLAHFRAVPAEFGIPAIVPADALRRL